MPYTEETLNVMPEQISYAAKNNPAFVSVNRRAQSLTIRGRISNNQPMELAGFQLIEAKAVASASTSFVLMREVGR